MREETWSPAELAPVVGVSESTLKRWVDRGHLRAERTPGGHRRIALPDLVSFLRARGRAVPSVAGLRALAGRGTARTMEAATPDVLARLLCLGDAGAASAIVLGQFREGRALDDLLDRLAAPAMTQVGHWWEQGQVDVYQEHVATLTLYGVLLRLRSLVPVAPDTAPLALGGAPERDPYLLPSLMAELILAEMGWRTINVGPDTPARSFREAIARQRPRLVWLSITSPDPAPGFLDEYPRMFEAAQAQGTSLMLGGQGLTAALQDRLLATAFGFRLAHLRAFARSLAGPPSAHPTGAVGKSS
jgi:excisionase family DNA binding protein